MSEPNITTIAKAAARLEASQSSVDSALTSLADLESFIHDALTGSADAFIKAGMLDLTRSIEIDLRKAQL